MQRATSWKVSAVWALAAAGTVLGLADIAAAQSAPRRVQPRVWVSGDDDRPQVRVQVQTDDDDQDGPKAERRIVIRKRSTGDAKADGGCCGDGCCCCGKGGDDGDREGEEGGHAKHERHEIHIQGMGGAEGFGHAFGLGGGGKAIVVGPDGEHQNIVKQFHLGGGQGGRTVVLGGPDGKVNARVSGTVVIVGEDGKVQRFNFGQGGDDEGHAKVKKEKNKVERRIFLAPHGDGPDGDGPQMMMRPFGGFGGGFGGGAGGTTVGGPVRGEIVIVGPDGKEQTFSFGDQPGLQVHRLELPRQRLELPKLPMEFRDGSGRQLHLKMHRGGGQGDESPRSEGGWVM